MDDDWKKVATVLKLLFHVFFFSGMRVASGRSPEAFALKASSDGTSPMTFDSKFQNSRENTTFWTRFHNKVRTLRFETSKSYKIRHFAKKTRVLP